MDGRCFFGRIYGRPDGESDVGWIDGVELGGAVGESDVGGIEGVVEGDVGCIEGLVEGDVHVGRDPLSWVEGETHVIDSHAPVRYPTSTV